MAQSSERQLATECGSIDELREKLMTEGHTQINAHLQGSLRKDLAKLLKKASGLKTPPA